MVKIELAAGPRRRHPLRRIAQTEVDHVAAARNELQAGILPPNSRLSPSRPIPQARRRSVRRRAESPGGGAIGRRWSSRRSAARAKGGTDRATCSFCSRSEHRGAGGGEVERRERRVAAGERRKLALDEAGIDVAAQHLRMAQQRLQEGEIGGHALDLEPVQRLGHAARAPAAVAGAATISFASSAS